MARFVMWLARRMDVEGYFLMHHGGWRGRLGIWLDVRASWMACWAYRKGAR